MFWHIILLDLIAEVNLAWHWKFWKAFAFQIRRNIFYCLRIQYGNRLVIYRFWYLSILPIKSTFLFIFNKLAITAPACHSLVVGTCCCNKGEVMSEKEQSQHATKRPFHVSSQPSELSDLENPCTHRNKAVQHHLASNVPYGLFPIFTVSVFGTRALQTRIYACTCCSPCSKLKVFIWIKNTILKKNDNWKRLLSLIISVWGELTFHSRAVVMTLCLPQLPSKSPVCLNAKVHFEIELQHACYIIKSFFLWNK